MNRAVRRCRWDGTRRLTAWRRSATTPRIVGIGRSVSPRRWAAPWPRPSLPAAASRWANAPPHSHPSTTSTHLSPPSERGNPGQFQFEFFHQLIQLIDLNSISLKSTFHSVRSINTGFVSYIISFIYSSFIVF